MVGKEDSWAYFIFLTLSLREFQKKFQNFRKNYFSFLLSIFDPPQKI